MRDKKRIHSYRGSRRCGKGNVKNRGRKSSKGGRGNAGFKKHRKTYAVKYAKGHFGSKGFVPPKKKKVQVVNLFDIENLAVNGKLKSSEGKFVFEFDGKVLGSGFLSVPVSIKARSWTKKAEEKVSASGGEIASL